MAGKGRTFVETDQEVGESARLLRSMLDSLAAHIALIGEDGRILTVNRTWRDFADAHGLRMADHGVGANYLDACRTDSTDGDFVRGVKAGLRDVLSGRRDSFLTAYSCHSSKRSRWFEMCANLCRADGARWAVIAHQDITERFAAQDRLRQRDAELAHVGRLAVTAEIVSGITHELNQPLASIVNYCDGCIERMRSGRLNADGMADALRRARDLAHQAGETTRRLRHLIKKTPPHNSSIDVSAAVREVLDLLRYEFDSRGAEVRTELSHDLPWIPADRVRLQQVLMNLILNALAAMESCAEDRRRVTVATEVSDRCVVVSVRDTGPGFPFEVGERIFEAFFTTKADGLGMGLPVSRSIVEEHGGTLTAARDGGETVFRFTLPLHACTRR